MNVLNVGPGELIFILIIAILVVGPERLVEIVRGIRRFSAHLRSLSDEASSTIQAEMRAAGDETEEAVRDVATVQAELQAAAQEARQAMEQIVKDEVGSSITAIQSELEVTVQETHRAIGAPVEGKSGAETETESGGESGDEAQRSPG